MTAKIISELLEIGEDLKQKAIQIDINMERSIAFGRGIDQQLSADKEIYKNLKIKDKQSRITSFFKEPSTPTATMSSTSTGTPTTSH